MGSMQAGRRSGPPILGVRPPEVHRMARVLKPPSPLTLTDDERSVFLAGSIEMGLAEPWQAALEQALADLPVAILNPRRDAWAASWEQSIHNPPFREQVEWELEAQERASIVAMYFAPPTKRRSPCWSWDCSPGVASWSSAVRRGSGGAATSRWFARGMGFPSSASCRIWYSRSGSGSGPDSELRRPGPSRWRALGMIYRRRGRMGRRS